MNELDTYMMEIALKYPRKRISDKFTENDIAAGGRFRGCFVFFLALKVLMCSY
jgi:hypothetical protein